MNGLQPTVRVKDVHKTFDLQSKGADGILSKLLVLLSSRSKGKKIKALSEINIEVSPGEIVGVIGRNGSGKSTLLNVLSGIYQANQGEIMCPDKVVYLSGFGLGLKEKLTMRENIYLIGTLMGLSIKQIKRHLEDIIELSGLSEFLEAKVFQFSSGMLNRLRFATTISLLKETKVDLLLLDEVFGGGGDLLFESKAIMKMENFIKQGAAVLLVSHNLKLIEKYCSRAILLEKGIIIKDGQTDKVVTAYQELVKG